MPTQDKDELKGSTSVSCVGVDEMRNRSIDPLFPLSDYWKASPQASSIETVLCGFIAAEAFIE